MLICILLLPHNDYKITQKNISNKSYLVTYTFGEKEKLPYICSWVYGMLGKMSDSLSCTRKVSYLLISSAKILVIIGISKIYQLFSFIINGI